MPPNRRAFLSTTGLMLGAAAFAPEATLAMPPGASDALHQLLDGNIRFTQDRAHCPPLTARRLELAAGQAPFAIIVSCSDSRVPVETVFDQPPGNIFGIRLAGNFVDDDGIGSIEYSVAALKSSLILILGHTNCGAVKAALEYVKNGTPQPGYIQNLVNAIAPAVKASKGHPGDALANATKQNVKMNMTALIERSKIVSDAIRANTLAVAGGIYDLHSGRVTLVHER